MSNLVFPQLRGVGWGTKVAPHGFFGKQTARSGRSVSAQFSSQPVMKFSIVYSGSPGDSGFLANADFETMLGFFCYHGAGAQSFLFQGVNSTEAASYTKTAEPQFTGDGATAIFQLVRNRGIWQEAIYWPQGAVNIYVNGQLASATALGNGVFQLASAPASGAQVTATFTFAYRCKFDAEEVPFTNWINGYWAADTPLITIKP